jgi:molybdate transport system substrate-binding protein
MKQALHRLEIRPQQADVIKRGVAKASLKNVAVGLAALACFAWAGITQAAEIKALVALGIKDVVDDIGPKFEQASGHKLAIKFGTLGGLVKMVQGGETADIIIIPRQGIDGLVKDGKATPGSETDIARSDIVVIVRQGAPKPDVSTPEALKRSLLAAKSITYGNPADGGASSIHFAKVLDRLGIAKEMKPKTTYSKAGRDTGDIVAAGKAELGVNQLQVMMPVAGIEVAGPLPGDLQAKTIFTSAILSGAKNAAPAQALVKFLRTPEAAKVFRAKGMNPV